MKWKPLTSNTLQELIQNGYTHLVMKSKADLVEISDTLKEFITLEAIKPGMEEGFDNLITISPDLTGKILQDESADYYVLYK